MWITELTTNTTTDESRIGSHSECSIVMGDLLEGGGWIIRRLVRRCRGRPLERAGAPGATRSAWRWSASGVARRLSDGLRLAYRGGEAPVAGVVGPWFCRSFP